VVCRVTQSKVKVTRLWNSPIFTRWQNISPPPFVMEPGKWPLLIMQQWNNMYILYRSDFISVPVFGVTWLQNWNKINLWKSRPSVPYGANFCLFRIRSWRMWLCYLLLCNFQAVTDYATLNYGRDMLRSTCSWPTIWHIISADTVVLQMWRGLCCGNTISCVMLIMVKWSHALHGTAARRDLNLILHSRVTTQGLILMMQLMLIWRDVKCSVASVAWN